MISKFLGVRSAAAAAFVSLTFPALASTTIVPVPVKPNASAPYTVAGAYSVRVEDAANSLIFANVDTHVHKVRYSNTLGTPPATSGDHDLVTNVYYTHFSFGGGSAKVKITLPSASSTFTYTLSPQSYNISSTKSTSPCMITFTLTQSRYLMLKVNDPAYTPYYLIIIADALETNVPPSSGSGIYNITSTQFAGGAKGDYSTNSEAAIQAAVDAAFSAGGGIVYVPAGVYKVGNKVSAHSNVSVYMEPGAYIRVADNLDRATVGSKIYMFDAPSGSNISNFKLYGRGTLDCNAIGAGGHRVSKSDVQTNGVLSMALRTDNCSGITVDGIVLRESTGWMVHPDRCDNVIFVNTKVVNYVQDFNNYRENDGLDLIQCQDSSVTHSLVFTADDAVCMKGSDGFDTTFESVDNVIYYDLVLFSGADGAKFGMQAQAPISDSFFKNIDIVQAKRAIAIHVTSGGSLFNHIGFVDVRCENVGSRPIDFELLTTGVTADVTNASIVNFTCNNFGPSNSTIEGQSGATFNGVAFNNLTIGGTVCLTASAAHITTNSFATNITFAQSASDANTILSIVPTSFSANWKTTGSFSIAAINDGVKTNEGQVTDFADAQVVYPVPNEIISSAVINQDNGNFSCSTWKLERQDVVTNAWSTVFDFTSCPIGGDNTVNFSPTLAKAVRITFHPASGKQVGINEVEVYGR